MKKILKIAAIVVLALVLLTPIPLYEHDGGTEVYQAILYSVTNYHRLKIDPSKITKLDTGREVAVIEYDTGIEVKVLGITLYSNTTFGK
jgi:hypothetical protein